MEFNKINYLKMVNFIRANTGRVFALYDPPPGKLIKVKGLDRQLLLKVPGLKDPEALKFHLKHYISNYKLYPDEPMVTFSEDYRLIKIEESWNTRTTITKFTGYRGRFYDAQGQAG